MGKAAAGFRCPGPSVGRFWGDCAEVACLAASGTARVGWVGGFGDAIPLGLCGGGVDGGLGEPGTVLWTQSDALGWYAAFLQNAGGVGWLCYSERWSGVVCGVPLGHGARGEG